MAYIISVISDTHTNSTVGLLDPDGMSLDDGGRRRPNPIQSHLYERFSKYLDTLRGATRKGDKVYGIHLADAVDNIAQAKTTQLISRNEADIVRGGYDTLRPWVDLCRDGVFMIRGTPAHVGQSGYLEEILADRIGTLRWPKDSSTASLPYLEATFGGVFIHAAHHATLGRLPWTRLNSLGNQSYKLVNAYAKKHQPPPTIALRGHCHRTADSHDAYPVRFIIAPCWQMQTEYGNKLSPGELPEIGGIIITIDGGQVDVNTIIYPPDPEAAWGEATA